MEGQTKVVKKSIKCDLLVLVGGDIIPFPSALFLPTLSPCVGKFEKLTQEQIEQYHPEDSEIYFYELKNPLSRYAIFFLKAFILDNPAFGILQRNMDHFKELWSSGNFNTVFLISMWTRDFVPILSSIKVWNQEHVSNYKDYIDLLRISSSRGLPITLNVVPPPSFLSILNQEYELIVNVCARNDCNTELVRLKLWAQFIINTTNPIQRMEMELAYSKFFP